MIHFFRCPTVPPSAPRRAEPPRASGSSRAALDQVAEGGYASAGVQAVAARAGVAVGTVYRHFPSKGDLFAEVVPARLAAGARRRDRGRRPSRRRARAERVAAAVEAFARRALAGPVLAYALLAEPVDPAVEAERLRFRLGYRDAFARVLDDGVARRRAARRTTRRPSPRRWSGRSARRSSAPSPPRERPRARHEALVATLVQFCLNAITTLEEAHRAVLTSASTHEVLNQAPPIAPYNVFEADLALREALEREGGGWGVDRAARHRRAGGQAGGAGARRPRRAQRAASCAPTTATATASTRSSSTRPGTGCCARRSSARSTRCRGATRSPGAHVVRAALLSIWSQVDSGVMCPVSMTYAGDARAARAARAGRRVGAAPDAARATTTARSPAWR